MVQLLGKLKCSAAATAVLLAAFLLAESPVEAETIFIQQGLNGYTGATDTTMYQDGPENSAGGFPWIYGGVTQFNSVRRSLLKFDLAGAVPADSVITSVSLALFSDLGRTGLYPCAVHKITRSWNEGNTPLPSGSAGGAGAPASLGDTTWSHVSYNTVPWVAPGGEFETTPSGSGVAGNPGTTTTLTGAGMVEDVQAWLADPSSNHGWILLVNEAGSHNAKRFMSSESPVLRPLLTITTAEPSAAKDWNLYE